MGYKSFLRAAEASHRRHERESMRRHRELQKQAAKLQRQHDKETERLNAEHEVETFENYLDLLTSVHKDCGDPWDWQVILNSPPPKPPPGAPKRQSLHGTHARKELDEYVPGFFAKLFGFAKKEKARREQALTEAEKEDERLHQTALAEHAGKVKAQSDAKADWEVQRTLAQRILNKDVVAYRQALQYIDPFAELGDFKTRVSVSSIDKDLVSLSCLLEDEELVPSEEIKLTSTGKVTRKEMASGRHWAIHQDYVCSCALRIARETFAALPIPRVIVNMQARRMNSATGHVEVITLLGVHFLRSALQRVNMEAIDPSDSMQNFNFRMKFKKSTGFEAIDKITPDEQWISA